MIGEELQRRAHAGAERLPGATLEHPFGPEWDVYKVRGKVFMLMSAVTGEPTVTLKVEPEDGRALREQHDFIIPGYHMNKKHWITVHPSDDVEPTLIDDLVIDSYLLVVEKLPRAQRPVDPSTYGRVRR